MSYYNICAKYEIIGRIVNGTKVTAYMLEDRIDNSIFSMEKAIVEQLALNKQIYNCRAQVYDNLVNLKGINCKLSKLHKYNANGTLADDEQKRKAKVVADLILIGKIAECRITTDYVVSTINSPDVTMKIPKETVLQLALEGRFKNAKVQMNGNELLLRGKGGTNLNKLTTYTIEKQHERN
jgi:hypothetical protein